MSILLENFQELVPDLTVYMTNIFDRQMKSHKDYVAQIFDVQSTDKYQEHDLGMGELGLMDEWNASGRQVSYEDFAKGFQTTFTQVKYTKGIQIEKDLIKFGRKNEIIKRPKKLARTAYFTRMNHGIGVFGNAFSSSKVGADGLSLCNSAHPVAPGSSTTYSNASAAALSASALEDARTAMMNWKDDKGNLLVVEPDTLIVPPALRKKALIIADTAEEPDTTDHGVNVWKGAVNVIEVPFLAKWSNTAWFLLDSYRAKEMLRWLDAEVPSIQQGDIDFNRDLVPYKITAWFTYGWTDPSFIYGSTGQG